MLRTLFLLAGILLLFTDAWAAQPDYGYDDSNVLLPEMVVTATRRPISLENAPAVVDVITAEDIAATPALNLADILETQAGIYTFQPQGVGIVTPQDIRLRGTFGTERVLLLLDGQPFDDPYTNYWVFSYIPLEAIERIEIVRGPFSALYGTGALGGVISIFTKDGSGFGKGKIEGGIRAGNFGRLETVESAGASLNDELSFFISHQYSETENYFLNDEDIAKENIRDSVDNRDHEQNRFHFNGRWRPHEGFRANLSGGYFASETGFGFSPLTGSSKENEIDRWYVNLSGEMLVRDDLDIFFGLDGIWRERPVDGDTALDQSTVVDSVNLNEDSRIRAVGGLHWSITPDNVFSLGAEVWQIHAEQSITSNGEDLAVFFREPDDLDTTETNFALFAQDDWIFGQGAYELVLGLRYDNYGETDDAISPKGSVIWNYLDNGRIKISAAQAFRSPSISERKSPFWNLTVQPYPFPVVPPPATGLFAVSFNSNEDLDSEKLTSVEVSFENEFLDDKLSTRLTPFWVHGEDFITTVNVTDTTAPGFFVPFPPPGSTRNFSTLTTPTNLDEVIIKGLEFEVEYRPIPELTIFANYLYQDAKDEETDDQLDFYPYHVAREGVRWHSRHFTDFLGFTAGVVAKQMSEYEFTDLGGRESGTLEGFNVVDAMIGLDFWKNRLFVTAEMFNVFNEEELYQDTDNVLPERSWLIGSGLKLSF